MDAAKTRRRGAELEAAILSAAWDQLVAEGYSRFTIDAVAERARTSKPVLYRRWSSREQLLRATIRHRGENSRPTIPDTGSLRDDLIENLSNAAKNGGAMGALLTALATSHVEDIGMTPAELRAELIGPRATSVSVIFSRAVERGELDAARLTPRVVDLPFTLFRNEYLMTFAPPDDDAITEFVDEIVLPVLRPVTPR